MKTTVAAWQLEKISNESKAASTSPIGLLSSEMLSV